MPRWESVEDADEMKPGKPRIVEVELPHDCGVQGKVAEPVESVPQENVPFVLAFTSQLAALSPETIRLVDEAVTA